MQAIVQAMPKQKAIAPDESGRRISGAPARLHVFVAARLTLDTRPTPATDPRPSLTANPLIK